MIYDYAIVGAGIIGLATGYHIKRLKPDSNVVILDRNPGPGMGNTAKSAAAFRAFFYSRANMSLAYNSIEFYRHLQQKGVELDMMFVGYLYLVPEERFEVLRPVLKELERRGAKYVVYDGRDLERMIEVRTKPSEDEEGRVMGLEDVAFGVHILNAGFLSPEKLVEYYYEEFGRLGGKCMFNAEVTSLLLEPKKAIGIPEEPLPWQDVVVSGVVLSNGHVVRAKSVILATNAWTESILDRVGLAIPVKPKKRQIFSVRADTLELKRLLFNGKLSELGVMPFTILPRHVYIRPEPKEGSFWIGLSDRINRPFGLEDEPQPEEKFWRYGIYPVLTKYFPQFEGKYPTSAWAGYYDIMYIDEQPVVDQLAEGLIVVAGLSGSGIMKADSVGRIAAHLALGHEVAELYTGELFKVSDLSIGRRRVEREILVF